MAEPEKRFRFGACSASVFANQINTAQGPTVVKNVSLQRAYKDKDGTFQHTSSLGVNDIPKAVLALTKAYEYLLSQGKAE